jgi:hypothetical protein
VEHRRLSCRSILNCVVQSCVQICNTICFQLLPRRRRQRETICIMVSGWGSSHSHLHLPRRSHDQSDGDSKHSRSSSPDDELPRRSSSDATPRQTPATTRFLASDHDSNRTQEYKSQDVSSSSKRLGFFADKISSSFAGSGHSATNLKTSLHPGQLLHPLSHTRNDSTAASASTTTLPTMTAPSSMPNVVKSHSSPSKVPAVTLHLPPILNLIVGFVWTHI